MGAYTGLEHVRIVATLGLVKYFRAFIRSDKDLALDPYETFFENKLTKAQAQKKLAWLVDMAINRKAGIPDTVGRKQDRDYQIRLYRDCSRLHDRVRRRIRVYQFETAEVRARFSHLLSDWRED